MSVLDAFYILFKTQGTEEVKKSEDDIKKSGDNLNQSLKESASISGKMSDSFGNLGNQLIHTLTAAVSIGSVLAGIKNSINYAEDLDLASQKLAVNVGELDAWGNAIQRTGGTAEQFQGSLSNLAKRLGTSGETALRVLPQLADAFQRMGRSAAIRYGETLGLDENTILLLQKGRREVEAVVKQQKELGVVSKKNSEQAREFNYAWQDATHSLRTAFMGVAEELFPLLIKAINAFGKAAQFFSKHTDLIVGGLIAVGAASIFAFPELYAGIAVVTALGAAFSLIYEDIKFFIEGQDSLIGHILTGWSEVGKVVRATIHEFEAFAKFLERVYNAYYKFLSGGKTFRIYGEYGDQGIDDSKENTPKSYFQRLSESNKAIDLENRLSESNKAIDLANKTPLNSQTSSSILNKNVLNNGDKSSSRNVTINTGGVTINTKATDANSTAEAFGDHLNKQLTQASNYFDDGVAI